MKRVLFVATISLCSFLLNAQSTSFGIKGGLNVANLNVESSSNPDSKLSFNLGALAHVHLSENFAVQPELYYSGQGAKQTISGTEYKTNLGYINLPVLLQFMFGTGFRLESGPQVGFLISAKSKSGSSDIDIKDQLKKIDFSWGFGAGYVTTAGFGIDLRYNLGLSDIDDSGTGKVTNRVFSAGIFYQFAGTNK
jgi:hypothetical protein